MQRLELLGADGSATPLEYAPLLVVGAPRSGSTLLYQLLVQRFDVTYLANRHCAFFGAPSLVERLGGRSASPPVDYGSTHGLTEGPWGPSECGPFWYRFFRKSPQFVSLGEARPQDLRRLRAACRRLGSAGRRPLVFKNLLCALRLEPIAAALPEARFVVIRRDLEEHARSILAARQRANGEVRSWWSAEPPGWRELSALAPAEQAVGQIEAIHATIDDARGRIGGERFIDVAYDDLIDDVGSTLDTISAFSAGDGAPLSVRGSVPGEFPRRQAASIAPELNAALAAYVGGRRGPVHVASVERPEQTR